MSPLATMRAIGLSAMLAASACADAATVLDLIISRDHDTYEIRFDAVVNAPAPQVYRVLSDFALLTKLSPAIVSVRVEHPADGGLERVHSVLKGCFLIFCKEAVEVDEVTESNPSTIAARIVPGQSDFKSGSYVWRIQGDGERTLLRYHATRTPAFWVPPLIGPWIIERTMRKHVQASAERLESLATGTAPK